MCEHFNLFIKCAKTLIHPNTWFNLYSQVFWHHQIGWFILGCNWSGRIVDTHKYLQVPIIIRGIKSGYMCWYRAEIGEGFHPWGRGWGLSLTSTLPPLTSLGIVLEATFVSLVSSHTILISSLTGFLDIIWIYEEFYINH